MTTTTTIDLENMLSMFSGSDVIHRHGRIFYTDGIEYLAETAQCYWLLDLVASYQSGRMLRQEFQVWKLTVDLKKGKVKAVVTCDDGNGNLLIKQKIQFTDFPLKEIKMYYENNTLCLPSER